MNESLTIALDAMGGDHAPHSVIEGAHRALFKCPDVRYRIFGDETKINAVLDAFPQVREKSTIHHTQHRINDDDKPSVALRQGRQSSMRLAIESVADKRSDAIVSAGNTGALMAMGKIVFRMLEGIYRPAIIGLIPTMKEDIAFLDLGANVECDAETLFQFAIMGDAYARVVLKRERPTIGLLNVGSEEMKGHEEVKTAHTLLKNSELNLNFYGFVEGTDITGGAVDVVVTDGFTGNVALKTAEGTAKMFSSYFKMAFSSSWLSKVGYLLARKGITSVRKRLDPRRHNGAMLIGLNGILVKSHGSADALAFSHAIQVAVLLARHKINEQILDEIRKSGVTGLAEESAGTI